SRARTRGPIRAGQTAVRSPTWPAPMTVTRMRCSPLFKRSVATPPPDALASLVAALFKRSVATPPPDALAPSSLFTVTLGGCLGGDRSSVHPARGSGPPPYVGFLPG